MYVHICIYYNNTEKVKLKIFIEYVRGNMIESGRENPAHIIIKNCIHIGHIYLIKLNLSNS